jgi:hypothetical protein
MKALLYVRKAWPNPIYLRWSGTIGDDQHSTHIAAGEEATLDIVMAYKEWQHDGFASTFPFQPIPNPSGKVDFDPTWAIEANYSQPLGDWPLTYKGLVVMHGQKGCGEPCQPSGPGLLRTTEVLTQQVLVFDVCRVVWNLPRRYVIFGGYRWWKNKFGISPDQPNGVLRRYHREHVVVRDSNEVLTNSRSRMC